MIAMLQKLFAYKISFTMDERVKVLMLKLIYDEIIRLNIKKETYDPVQLHAYFSGWEDVLKCLEELRHSIKSVDSTSDGDY